MTIYAFPRDGIAYIDSLYAAMERQNHRVRAGVFAFRWLMAETKRGDVLHLHWPSFDYVGDGVIGSCRGFVRWLVILLVARARGVRLFWTAHNVYPHARSRLPFLDVWARHIVIGLAERIFVHGVEAARKLVAVFPAAAPKLVQIPHGHWIGTYPATATRTEARRRLGVSDDRPLFLFIGSCRAYKNIEALVVAFRALAADSALCIAGRFADPTYRWRIESIVGDDDRIVIHDRFIPDDAMGDYLLACDVVVAPYKETLTSGTAMLAISAGRPIVSLATGHLLDVVDAHSGVLYEPADERTLAAALDEARTRDFDERRILDRAARFSFDDAARITAQSFGEASRSRG